MVAIVQGCVRRFHEGQALAVERLAVVVRVHARIFLRLIFHTPAVEVFCPLAVVATQQIKLAFPDVEDDRAVILDSNRVLRFPLADRRFEKANQPRFAFLIHVSHFVFS